MRLQLSVTNKTIWYVPSVKEYATFTQRHYGAGLFWKKYRQTAFCLKLSLFEICRWNTTASTKTFIEIQLRRNFALQFTSYLSITLSKILPHSKIIKNAKKLSVFGENNSRCLSNFLQAHIFWNFDHISRIYN